jgi:hypothetical protein
MEEQTLGTVEQGIAPLVPLQEGGHRMASAPGKELVMQVWTIQPLPREMIGVAKS